MAHDHIKNWTRTDLARHQIDVAVELLLDKSDYVCSTTLAGAAEEILGIALRGAGEIPALDDFIDEATASVRVMHQVDIKRSALVDLMNFARNSLKHLGDGSDLLISRDVAISMLNRAITNYWKLTSDQTPQMRRFVDECLSA